MGVGFEVIYKDLAKYLDRYQIKLGFNPGTYQLRAGPKANTEMLKRTDVLSLNVEEAQSWVGECGRDPRELCEKLAKFGPKAIVLTDGRSGAYSFSEEGFYYISEFPGERVEATGAGDGFTTAYIAALILEKTHAEALRWGTVNAASVVGQVGPQAGLLSKKEIEAKLSKAKKYQPKEIERLKIKN
jgi:sugar/nucleoside kinase (ribokinase family)